MSVALNGKPGIFVYESGDHGITILSCGFTAAVYEHQYSQGYFHIIGVVQAKVIHEIIKKIFSPGIMKESELLKNSQVIKVTIGGEKYYRPYNTLGR